MKSVGERVQNQEQAPKLVQHVVEMDKLEEPQEHLLVISHEAISASSYVFLSLLLLICSVDQPYSNKRIKTILVQR